MPVGRKLSSLSAWSKLSTCTERKTHNVVDDLAGYVGNFELAHNQLVRLDVFLEALLGVRRQLEHHRMAAPGTGHQ